MRGCYLLVMIVACGCLSERTFELPAIPPQLVINCLFQPDSVWNISVSRSGSSTDELSYFLPAVTNAVVELWEDGKYIGVIPHTQGGNYRLNAKPAVGLAYELRVRAAGFEEVRAKSKIPASPARLDATWDWRDKIPQTDPFGGVFDVSRLKVILQDPPEPDNFYLFGIAYRDSCVCRISPSSRQNLQLAWGRNDSLLVFDYEDTLKRFAWTASELGDASYEDNQRMLLPDATFNGQERQLNLFMSDSAALLTYIKVQEYYVQSPTQLDSLSFKIGVSVLDQKSVKVYLDAWSLSRELHQYLLTLFLQGRDASDPFATFSNVTTNVEGGLGIFAGYQRRLILLYSD